jgi:hypothetical protein
VTQLENSLRQMPPMHAGEGGDSLLQFSTT